MKVALSTLFYFEVGSGGGGDIAIKSKLTLKKKKHTMPLTLI